MAKSSSPSVSEKLNLALGNVLKSLDLPVAKIYLERPAHEDHGDYATSLALQLTKIAKRSPREIAAAIKSAFEQAGLGRGELAFLAKVEVAGPGFVNFFLSPKWLYEQVLPEIINAVASFSQLNLGQARKVVVEHTQINPNKASHVGHLRNAILGDTLVRILAKTGWQVEAQNLINDIGVQVADTVTALKYLGKKQPADQAFDDFCWDIYAEINRLLPENAALQEKRAAVARAMEAGDNEVALFASQIVAKLVGIHLAEMAEFGIDYDLLYFESDSIKEGFWRQAFESLKKSVNFYLAQKGKNAGCWVLRHDDSETGEKVMVRSDQTTVYAARDVAYHLWKFGLLGKDFHYSLWPESYHGRQLWRTDADHGREKPGFGRADAIINVIDVRQTHEQEMVRLALQVLGFAKAARGYKHLAYGVVNLSPETARELKVDTSANRLSYPMSGRQGIGVKTKELLRLLVDKIKEEKGETETGGAKAKDVAVGALRYYMLRFNTGSDITFDYREAINLYGETGPYLMYAHARACGILRNAKKQKIPIDNQKLELVEELNPAAAKLLKLMARWPEVLAQAAVNLAPNLITTYAYDLATTFTGFYETSPVLRARGRVQAQRLSLVKGYQTLLAEVLTTLGIAAPERM